jgi:CCR4-NOT transcription complex subunit 1
MLSVVADQLRYPSAHTLFFISFLLNLFVNAAHNDGHDITERIGRVLLERVLVAKPHPWGLIIAFIELLENDSCGFWKQPFVSQEDEILALFKSAHRNFQGAPA